MALQSEAIESRLEDLRLDGRRTSYDSKMRALRRESNAHVPAHHLAPKAARSVEPEEPIDKVVGMLEELSRRMDELEKNNRNLGQMIRHRGKQERRWRSTALVGAIGFLAFLYMGGLRHWF